MLKTTTIKTGRYKSGRAQNFAITGMVMHSTAEINPIPTIKGEWNVHVLWNFYAGVHHCKLAHTT
jgi:hypothetical protein